MNHKYLSNRSFLLCRAAIILLLISVQVFSPVVVLAENVAEENFASRNLVIPEREQYNLGAKLFREKDRKVVAWKAYQTFLNNYPDSALAIDAQFMVAESIFVQAVSELQAGNPPDEASWKERKKGGLSMMGRNLKKSVNEFKNLGSGISSESNTIPEPDRIEVATFSEAIKQYEFVTKSSRKSGLIDSALYRIGECYYNMGDYSGALKYFLKVQKDFPQSYMVGESILASAQCYIPGGDFSSAESELQRLVGSHPGYAADSRVKFIQGIIRYQQSRYDDAVNSLDGIQTPDALFYSGQALLKQGKGIAASAKFKEIFEKFPGSRFAEVAFYRTADSFFAAENYGAAFQEFKKFLSLYPQSSLKEGALFRLGACSFMQRDYAFAREAFAQLLNAFPTGEFAPLARYFVGESYRMAKQLKEASFSYGQLITQYPNNPITANGRFKLALVTYQQQDYSGAVESFQKFFDWAQFHPMVPYAYFLLGNSHYRLKRFSEAASAYQQSFDRSQKTDLAESAIALLNRTQYEQGFYGQLTSGYTYILRSLPPTDSRWRAISMLYLADAYYRQGLYKEALSIFQSIASLYPYSASIVQARDGLSWCYFQLGEYGKAQTERENLQSARLPEGVSNAAAGSGNYELANALFNQKKYLQAIELYQRHLAGTPTEEQIPETLYRIGLCYYRQESYSQAIESWQSLVTKYPTHPRSEEAAFQIADTYFRAQKYDDAVSAYRQIITQYPQNAQIPEAQLRVGQSYYNAGKNALAIPEFESFLRQYSNDKKATQILDLLEAGFDRLETNGGSMQFDRDQEILRKLTNLQGNPTFSAEIQHRLARRYFDAKKYEAAAVEFDQGMTRYPGSTHSADAQFYSAESNYILKKYEDAIAGFQRFINNYSGSALLPAAYFRLATCHYNLQNHSAAIEFYGKLYALYPTSEYTAPGLFNMALSQQKLLLMSDSADTYQKLIADFPQDPNIQFAKIELAKIKQELHLFDDSVAILKEVDSKLSPNDEQRPEILYLMATAYLLANQETEGIATLQMIAKIPGQDTAWQLESLRKLGEIYEKKESWAEAVTAYEAAAKLAGNTTVGNSFRDRAKYFKVNYLGAAADPSPKSKKKK